MAGMPRLACAPDAPPTAVASCALTIGPCPPAPQRLQADFERKRGSGVPVSVMVHEAYLTDR